MTDMDTHCKQNYKAILIHPSQPGGTCDSTGGEARNALARAQRVLSDSRPHFATWHPARRRGELTRGEPSNLLASRRTVRDTGDMGQGTKLAHREGHRLRLWMLAVGLGLLSCQSGHRTKSGSDIRPGEVQDALDGSGALDSSRFPVDAPLGDPRGNPTDIADQRAVRELPTSVDTPDGHVPRGDLADARPADLPADGPTDCTDAADADAAAELADTAADQGPPDLASAPDLTAELGIPADACQPDCSGKECGPDGCGGDCGDCDDGNPCSEDFCDLEPGECVHVLVPCPPDPMCPAGPCEELFFVPELGLYEVVSKCLSSDPCVIAFCGPDNTCVFKPRCPDTLCEVGVCEPESGKCNSEPKCKPPDACHTARCNPLTGKCSVEPKCKPNACQTGNCDPLAGICVYSPIDCDDGDPCTEDRCDGKYGCLHLPGCCTSDDDCDDGNLCTQDQCIQLDTGPPAPGEQKGVCRHVQAGASCCWSSFDCLLLEGLPPASGVLQAVCGWGDDGGTCGPFWTIKPHCDAYVLCNKPSKCTKAFCHDKMCNYGHIYGCCTSIDDCKFGGPDIGCSMGCLYTCLGCLADKYSCTSDYCEPITGEVSHVNIGECVKGKACKPDCDGRDCGPDGCGGWCGTCDPGAEYCDGGKCICQPNCGDYNQCEQDGCGGSCGECGPGLVCTKGTCWPPTWCGDGTCLQESGESVETCPADCG